MFEEIIVSPNISELDKLDPQVSFFIELGSSIAEVEATHDEGYKFLSLDNPYRRQIVHNMAYTQLSDPAIKYLDNTFGFKPTATSSNLLSALTGCYRIIQHPKMGELLIDEVIQDGEGLYVCRYSNRPGLLFNEWPFKTYDFLKSLNIHKGFKFLGI